jgi:hypothetical protein
MKIKDFIGVKAKYDEEGQLIWGVDENGRLQHLADIRAWGAIQNLFINKDKSIDLDAASNFQDEFGEWIVEAINEKLEREQQLNTINK